MSRTYYTHIMLWASRTIVNTTILVLDMHSNSIRSSALISLILISIYILSPYVPICFLASCFIYYIHINIVSVSILIILIILATTIIFIFLNRTNRDLVEARLLRKKILLRFKFNFIKKS